MVDGIPQMSVETLKKKLDAKENIFVLDVREPHEVPIANIGRAADSGWRAGEAHRRRLRRTRTTRSIIHCRSGARSQKAALILKEAGFTNVSNLAAGFWPGRTRSIRRCRSTKQRINENRRRLLRRGHFFCYSGYLSEGLRRSPLLTRACLRSVRICRQSGRSSMQSILPRELRAFSMVEVRQGSVVTTNGQAVLGVAGALQDGVDVGADFGKRAGDGGDDAGLVVDDEAEVVRGEELAGDLALADGELDGLAALRDGEQVGDDGDCCGLAACAVAGEDDVAAEACR